MQRRKFLGNTIKIGTIAGLGLWTRFCHSSPSASLIEVGEGVVDTTPPLGIEMAGFHRQPGNERRITGIRQPTAARALVLKHHDAIAAIVSLDICAVSEEMAARVAERVAGCVPIPAANVRIVATHTHSMPTFRYFRQWGAISPQYQADVENRIVQAVEKAWADLAPGEVLFGRSPVKDGNFNRTTSSWKTEEQFKADSTDEGRWLDTALGALLFQRSGGKRNLLWYHFSAHPVCYTDGNAGPDWPGLVTDMTRSRNNLQPSFLQGHCGDVNPGSGKPWLGVPENVAEAVHAGIEGSLETAQQVKVDALRLGGGRIDLPLDVELLQTQLAQYQQDPTQCTSGQWVDARFAADWAKSAANWAMNQTTLPITVPVIRLGTAGLVFHPAELYSYYGLAIQRDSPLDHTLVVAYTDGLIGYLPDPNAYKAGEYAATTVPKILDLPPFRPEAAGVFASGAVKLMHEVAE
jgi:hypothetical protein